MSMEFIGGPLDGLATDRLTLERCAFGARVPIEAGGRKRLFAFVPRLEVWEGLVSGRLSWDEAYGDDLSDAEARLFAYEVVGNSLREADQELREALRRQTGRRPPPAA